MKSKITLDIAIENTGWKKIPKLDVRFKKTADAVFDHLPARLQFPFMVTALLTSDAAMRKLNRDFRGMDKPTNVLSFPQFDPRQLPKKDKRRGVVYLGDIALGYQYIVGVAKKDNKILMNYLSHLLIHGILHLLGYDHHSSTGAARMERLEKRIMASLGLPDPYAPIEKAARKR